MQKLKRRPLLARILAPVERIESWLWQRFGARLLNVLVGLILGVALIVAMVLG